MKSFLRVLKWILGILAVLIVGFVVFVYLMADRTYDAPYPDIVASQDSSLIERGRYLVNGPAHCSGCHAPRTEIERVLAGEEVPMSGGEDFKLPLGTIYTPNITPDKETGIGDYTDGELARTLRYGVKRNGQALFDFMPFYDISDRDLTAIISYLRSTEPVHNERPPHDWTFMGRAIRAVGLVKPMGDGVVPEAPLPDSTAEYGKYIAESVANCRGCHTQRDLMTGGYLGEYYSGQMAMDVVTPDGRKGYFVTPNLTPDPETGRITSWTEDQFIQRFRAGLLIKESFMPWGPFSRMSDMELKAIYRYLKTLDPVRAEKPIPTGFQEGPIPS